MNIDHYYEKLRYTNKSKEERLDIYKKRVNVYLEILKKNSLFNKRNKMKILDIGCGDGGLGFELKKHIASEVYGVDISKAGVSLANKLGIKSKVADVQKKIPFKSSSFDALIANEIIEHLYDTDTFINESKRILKKKGLFIIGTPNLSFWFNRVIFLLGIYPMYQEVSIRHRNFGMGFLRRFVDTQPVGHVRVYNTQALKDMLSFYGFEIISLHGGSVNFESQNSFLTSIYRLFDTFFSHFSSLSSDIIIIARKK